MQLQVHAGRLEAADVAVDQAGEDFSGLGQSLEEAAVDVAGIEAGVERGVETAVHGRVGVPAADRVLELDPVAVERDLERFQHGRGKR